MGDLVSVKMRLKLGVVSAAKIALRAANSFPETREAVKETKDLYTGFILRRFDKFSRGSGDWRKLQPATVERKGSSAILVNTRLMRLGLAIAITVEVIAGLLLQMRPKSGKKHPPSGLSIADIASIHHLGLGRVPARKIFVRPDRQTALRITATWYMALAKLAARLARGGI